MTKKGKNDDLDMVTIHLEAEVYDLLTRMAEQDLRSRRWEMNWIVVAEAIKRGLISENKAKEIIGLKPEVRTRN